MNKIIVSLITILLVISFNFGISAGEDKSGSFEVSVNIDKYCEIDLNDVNVEFANGINPNNDDIETKIGVVKGNYNFIIKVESEGLNSEDSSLNNKVVYGIRNGSDSSGSYELFSPGSNPGTGFNFNPETRTTPVWLKIDFKNDYNWYDFEAGNYNDTLTITLEAQ